ncbi:Hypothetical protein MAGb_0180 [Mycoplasmopsis agalactiae 14628]|uniref:Uncharacterized protein n=1 Tax=Mycoplasmopsis agalactiae 14628 TaxID=1110504 RepID=I5D6M7_MYCAA|nr:hypothetical protein [Mycoplasmopsis agalactiae]EIN15336.1 Hypothetical protein MAGb_0180 [Mycoplasmopsis agalactiae 14628]
MQNESKKVESKIEVLPVLKPISLFPEFIEKISGENKLKSNVITLIAIDNNDVYFVNGLLEENNDISNENIINIDTEDGILDNGKSAKVLLAKAIDLSVIYKMNYDELVPKIQTSWEDMARLPYISLKDQLKIVNWVTANIANQGSVPKLVVIRKKRREEGSKIDGAVV